MHVSGRLSHYLIVVGGRVENSSSHSIYKNYYQEPKCSYSYNILSAFTVEMTVHSILSTCTITINNNTSTLEY